MTSSQISNASIITYLSTATTTVSFTVTRPSETAGFSNMTIPKEVILQGTNPIVYIDGQDALNQGYAQDALNFYVWYTTEFSTHQMKIQFTIPQTPQVASFNPLFAIV
ncbi:MAG TPA: hypothetical protein VK253_08100, partial [Candidatus Binatia bacterium]|nr:hypothetical protein [Candidatus Binatia bacterium]